MRDKRIVSYVLQHRNLEIFLSPHIGFFSENYNKGALHRFKFRISVLWEFLVLYKFARRANSIIYRGARITPPEAHPPRSCISRAWFTRTHYLPVF
jgi:hypothetical protein